MDIYLMLKAVIMGLVEGATEFIPVSSTGHLIIAGEWLNFLDKDKRDVFEIMIQ
ncbi:MAG TPA: undecaprenyl-diphosphate phosphatase, partial [Methylophilus sp.]|nr:undecaprenyl-diphosphate phosphatase [Methylophilus sp.]